MTCWRTTEVDPERVRQLAVPGDLPLPLARVLVARGLADAGRVERFLCPRLSDLADPLTLPGMPAAVRRIRRAVRDGEPITVYGDYDVDGLTATALLVQVLRGLGARVAACLPHRLEEGYGLSVEALERCLEESRPGLVVTVDCGTRSPAAVDFARRRGVDVVVTDHHAAGSAPPAAPVALVNPKLGDGGAAAELAGVGVAFKLCHALLKDGRRDGCRRSGDLDLRTYLDLVALGTIADVVPVTGENRILVSHGLAALNQRARLGLRALADVAGVRSLLTPYHVGFVLGPRLNAVGRLGEARAALELLLTESSEDALRLARRLDQANRERRRIESGILDSAVERIEAFFQPERHFGLVLGDDGWHPGVVGIVASRLCARYRRPVVLIGFGPNGTGRGSCRSIEEFDLTGGLDACAELLLAYGGHAMAAGLTVARDRLDAFRRRFDAVCADRLRGQDLSRVQRIDAWIEAETLADRRFTDGVLRLQPFGEGNPEPVWGLRNVSVVGQPRIVGENHLKFSVAAGADVCEAIGFGMADRPVPEGPLDLAFSLDRDTYMGRNCLQFRLADFRPAGEEAGP